MPNHYGYAKQHKYKAHHNPSRFEGNSKYADPSSLEVDYASQQAPEAASNVAVQGGVPEGGIAQNPSDHAAERRI